MLFLHHDHRRSKVFVSFTRLLISCLGAGLSNFVWLGAFITFAEKPPGGLVSWLLWFLAPPIIALGFCGGIILFDYRVFQNRSSLLSVLPLPFVGCILGAAIAFQFGPMFIGFGTIALGGIAVFVREVYLLRSKSGAA